MANCKTLLLCGEADLRKPAATVQLLLDFTVFLAKTQNSTVFSSFNGISMLVFYFGHKAACIWFEGMLRVGQILLAESAVF